MESKGLQGQEQYEGHDLRHRVDEDVLMLLSTIPPAFISDSLKALGIRNHTVRHVKPLRAFEQYRNHVAGTAITLQVAPENGAYESAYAHREIIQRAQERDIVVIAAAGRPYAFWGDHTNNEAIKREVAGAVIDGYVRDSRPIRESRLPVFSLGSSPESFVERFKVVGYNVPVVCGDAMVCPGDVLVGDDDGVVAIPVEVLEPAVEGALKIAKLEEVQ